MSVTGSSLSAIAPNASSISFILYNRSDQYLIFGTGAVEAYNSLNIESYKIAAVATTGLDLHVAGLPAITVLPEKFSVLALDNADDSIVGVGEVTIDSANKHANNYITEFPLDLQSVDGYDQLQALEFIAAACAGNNSGVGTGVETYLGLDEATTRFTSVIDAEGNRTVTYGVVVAMAEMGLRISKDKPGTKLRISEGTVKRVS